MSTSAVVPPDRRRRRVRAPVDHSDNISESGEEADLGSGGGESDYTDAEDNLATPSEGDDDERAPDEEGGLEALSEGGLDKDEQDEEKHPLDDDEDRRNPQYIPKKGSFYEHDDRTSSSEAKEEVTKKDVKEEKKKVWKDAGDRWMHDKFNENEQIPKSREELISAYGYDIREEDGPPRARRRRRYGRGPNKYDRRWEDVDAYSKPVRGFPGRGRGRRGYDRGFYRGGRGDFARRGQPELKDWSDRPYPVLDDEDYFPSLESATARQRPLRNEDLDPAQDTKRSYSEPRDIIPSSKEVNGINKHDNMAESFDFLSGIERVERETQTESRFSYSPRSSWVRGGKISHRPGGKQVEPRSSSEGRTGRKVELPNADESPPSERKVEPKEKKPSRGSGVIHRQPEVPPRLQESRSKRYSTQRTRNLMEGMAGPSPFQQGQNFYEDGYQGQLYVDTTEVAQTSTTFSPATAPPTAPPFPAPPTFIPSTQSPRLFAPPHPPPPPPALPSSYLPSHPPPPPDGTMLNFPPSAQYPTQFPPPPAFQGFPPLPVSQPQEIFSNGVAYYNTHNQVMPSRTIPTKRPKAAIPIVPPPELQGKPEESQQTDRMESGAEAAREDVLVEDDESLKLPASDHDPTQVVSSLADAVREMAIQPDEQSHIEECSTDDTFEAAIPSKIAQQDEEIPHNVEILVNMGETPRQNVTDGVDVEKVPDVSVQFDHSLERDNEKSNGVIGEVSLNTHEKDEKSGQGKEEADPHTQGKEVEIPDQAIESVSESKEIMEEKLFDNDLKKPCKSLIGAIV
ncbi:unnamed protein product [Darwinula stevensoni]|uniref:Protein CASC3 n=1 Tax=Darwinula stevensoni TaxID=69355 RepID=A0A7R8WYB1_9CRUS|nr:unnamed protein product [Darwinula stevensoni]CAG0878840.1 unnamed protein product [Darwinula stevensoni]